MHVTITHDAFDLMGPCWTETPNCCRCLVAMEALCSAQAGNTHPTEMLSCGNQNTINFKTTDHLYCAVNLYTRIFAR